MKMLFKIVIGAFVAWLVIFLVVKLVVLLTLTSFFTKLSNSNQQPSGNYKVALTSSQRQSNDAEHASSTSVQQSSQSSLEGNSQASSYNATQGQCQDTSGNWKFVDKFNNPMPADWQPADGTDYQTHLNPNYQGD